jgi:Protein of unknown function (DUF3226)
MPPRENSPFRLLVEGSDDLHSVIHLMARHDFDWDDKTADRPFIANTGGLEGLLEELPIILKGPYERIGVIVDANTDLSGRWAQLRARVESAGLRLAEEPHREGTITPGLRPQSRVGFWLMPDNSSPGTLESFLRKLVPDDDSCWSYAEEAAGEARQRGARCRETDHLKSALHTWLAWQEKPGMPFGTALTARVLGHDSETALRFVAWFHRLFVEP